VKWIVLTLTQESGAPSY